VRRRRPPEAGHWGIPGGKVDWMELVEAAVQREVAEETDLTVRLLGLLCLADHFEPAMSPPQHWVSPIYLAEPVGSAVARLREPDVLSGVDWFPPEALPTPLTKNTIEAMAVLTSQKN